MGLVHACFCFISMIYDGICKQSTMSFSSIQVSSVIIVAVISCRLELDQLAHHKERQLLEQG